jgi:hypothetical protein
MIQHAEVTVSRSTLHGNADHVPVVAWQCVDILSPKNSD